MSGFTEPSNPVEGLKKDLMLLQAQRDALELEANAIASELNTPGANGEPPVGVKGALVDSDGFPLVGFDLFNIREKRHRFNCIQTDHKAIMARIERTLHELHEVQASSRPSPPSNPDARTSRTGPPRGVTSESRPSKAIIPIARVNQVSEGSPAADAGLTVGDLVIRFGNVDISHPKGLGGVVDVVREKEGQQVRVKVLRHAGMGGQSETKDMVLVPKVWGGRGLLGVHLLPP